MKTDKKEPFQGAPKGGPSMALELYSENTRRSAERNVRYFEGLKIRCAILSDLEPRNMIQISGHIGKIEEKRGKRSVWISFTQNSFILSDR